MSKFLQSVHGGYEFLMNTKECIVNNNCKISYDVASDKYSIESHSKDNILLVKDGKVVRCLGNGDRVKVSCEIILQLSGRGDSITLG